MCGILSAGIGPLLSLLGIALSMAAGSFCLLPISNSRLNRPNQVGSTFSSVIATFGVVWAYLIAMGVGLEVKPIFMLCVVCLVGDGKGHAY
jgi:hypothetical protein